MEDKRPTGITVLCILSWVWLLILSYNVLVSYSVGPMTAEVIRQQKIEFLAAQNASTDMEVAKQMAEAIGQFFETFSANFQAAHMASFFQILLGILATILMFNRRKIGFHLYIIYSLIPIGTATYFYGSTMVGSIFAIASGLFAVLFVILYGFQLKHMR